MEPFTTALIIIVFLAGGVFIIWIGIGMIKLIWNLGNPRPGTRRSQQTPETSDEIDGMNNGDYYNGPGGYHATGGYRNSFYGQMNDPDDDDEHQ